tara:strand:- start:420 stop:872 length:453 start_codon:yes stop_codon:yes gene_type:complete
MAEERRQRVVDSTVRLVDSEMASKSGLRSVPLKGAYKLVKGFKPGFVPAIIGHMLPEFCDALQPYFVEWVGKGEARGSLEAALKQKEPQVADALLAVADRRVAAAQIPGARGIQKAYRGLRGTARKHVAAALPGLARTVTPFLREAGVAG